MTKTRRTRTLPSPLRSSSLNLFLIAGFPNPVHKYAETCLRELVGPHAKIISVPSKSHNGPLFSGDTTNSLLRASAQFAIRRLLHRMDDQAVQPKSIGLFYVPAVDDVKLLEIFDFFVFPVPLRDLAKFDEFGKQRRHQHTACKEALKQAIETFKNELVRDVQPRIESRRSSEPLLLPPVNFHLPQRRLRDAFRELTRGTRAWKNAIPEKEIVANSLGCNDLPRFLHLQERQLIFCDARGVAFPCARATEMHGSSGHVAMDSDPEKLRDVLRSAYRFGAALPQGFHHDAQLKGNETFRHMAFDCSRDGSFLVTSTHVNIYPNDYVRSV